jgi:uncharacterized protein
MTVHRLELLIRDDRLAVCRLDPAHAIPSWATSDGFFSVTYTRDELSLVCPEDLVPEGVRAERGWRLLSVAGSIDFAVIGVLASLAVPLAEARVSLFAVSTFDTDHLLIKDHELGRAVEALTTYGHVVRGSDLRT